MTIRHMLRCAVCALIIKDNKILLLLRKGTGWMDGYYTVPSGHLEKGELIKEALVREVKEEVDLTVSDTDVTLYHVMHWHNETVSAEYIDFFFKVEYWTGEPRNAEPEKCEYVKWFDLDALPENIVPHVKKAIEFYKGKLFFSEMMR